MDLSVVHMSPPLALENHTLRVNGRTHPMVEYVRDAEHEIQDPTRQDLRKQSTSLNSLGVFFLIAPFFSSSLTVDCSTPTSLHSFVYSCQRPTSTPYTSFVALSPGLYTSKPLGRKTDTDLDLETRRGSCLVDILPLL
jgi:hypothetical protein